MNASYFSTRAFLPNQSRNGFGLLVLLFNDFLNGSSQTTANRL